MTAKLDLTQFEGHTPGPWHTGKIGTHFCILTASDYSLASVQGAYVKAEKVNAGLLAAAPALLSECRRQREEIARLLDLLSDAEFLMRQAGKIPGPMQDSFNRSAQDARAALKGGE